MQCCGLLLCEHTLVDMQTRALVRHLVSIEDTQQELGGISRTTLYRLIEEGHLIRARIGRRAFITGDSIAAFIASICDDAAE